MTTIVPFLSRQSRTTLIIVGLVLVVFLAGFDYLTGSELSFSIFYLIPVSLVAWLAGRKAGGLVAGSAALAWLSADLGAGHAYSHVAIPYWNALVRLGFFLSVTLALSALRRSRQRQENLIQFVVHDLRSPLSIILLGLRAVQDSHAESPDELLNKVLGNSLTSGNRMLALINSLLDLSRLEDGKMPLRMVDVEVRHLIETSLAQVEIWAGRSNVALQAQVQTNAELVHADYELTLRVLVNLLSNALKFSPPGSTVTVRVARGAAKEFIFSVIDQGPGIPQEWLDKVFDKYIQVDAGDKASSFGSGIGLSFCRLAVKAQGGQIFAESEKSKGTTVSFTLPHA